MFGYLNSQGSRSGLRVIAATVALRQPQPPRCVTKIVHWITSSLSVSRSSPGDLLRVAGERLGWILPARRAHRMGVNRHARRGRFACPRVLLGPGRRLPDTQASEDSPAVQSLSGN